MKTITRLAAWLLLVLLTTVVGSSEVLTNDTVIRMHEAGLPASVIIAKIESSETAFDTSVESLIDLAAKGIPDDVIAAMTSSGEQAGRGVASAGFVVPSTVTLGGLPTAQPRQLTDFNDPHCPEQGIFLVGEDDSVEELEPSTYAGGKQAGMWKMAMTYGIASTKSKAMIHGLKSHYRVRQRSPIFYFCFEEAESGLSYETYGATTPSQFLLVELDVKKDQNARLVVTGKFSTWSGGYAGPPPKYRVNFTWDKVADGVYKVSSNDLRPGEYAFFYTGSGSAGIASAYGLVMAGGGGKVFDFGVD